MRRGGRKAAAEPPHSKSSGRKGAGARRQYRTSLRRTDNCRQMLARKDSGVGGHGAFFGLGEGFAGQLNDLAQVPPFAFGHRAAVAAGKIDGREAVRGKRNADDQIAFLFSLIVIVVAHGNPPRIEPDYGCWHPSAPAIERSFSLVPRVAARGRSEIGGSTIEAARWRNSTRRPNTGGVATGTTQRRGASARVEAGASA